MRAHTDCVRTFHEYSISNDVKNFAMHKFPGTYTVLILQYSAYIQDVHSSVRREGVIVHWGESHSVLDSLARLSPVNTVFLLPSLMVAPICPGLCSGISTI